MPVGAVARIILNMNYDTSTGAMSWSNELVINQAGKDYKATAIVQRYAGGGGSGRLPQPLPKVVTTEWVDGKGDCTTGTVEQTRTKVETPFTWDGKAWVEDTANAKSTTETQTRPMSSDELKACTPQPKTKSRPGLPHTGAEGSAGMAAGAGLLVLVGAGLVGIARRSRTS